MYETLKKCLVLDETKNSDIEGIDRFFDGVMKSLFYRANGTGLVLVGRQGIGKTEFFRRLLPQREWITTAQYAIYHSLIIDFSEHDTKLIGQTLSNDGFIVNKDCTVNKRLASVVYTCNELPRQLQNRKSLAIVYLKHIDNHTFNSIDKTWLWVEIWNNFLRKHGVNEIFSEEDLNKYFKE